MVEIHIFENTGSENSMVIYFVAPFLVAIISYFAIDLSGEWKRRRSYSSLGVAIVKSLLEEVTNGVRQIRDIKTEFESGVVPMVTQIELPRNSWSGMDSIPNEVLLRILETTRTFVPEGDDFHPHDIRSHTKNYFENITTNFSSLIKRYSGMVGQKLDDIRHQDVMKSIEYYLDKSERVEKLLTTAIKNLEENRKRLFFPR